MFGQPYFIISASEMSLSVSLAYAMRFRSASSTVKTVSAMALPKKCIATRAVVDSGLAGYFLETNDAGAMRGLVIFPSLDLLEEFVKAGKLPDDIVHAVQQGDNERLGRLTEIQQCLAAGFTETQCERLKGRPKASKAPMASEQLAGQDPNSAPIPLYDVGHHRLLF